MQNGKFRKGGEALDARKKTRERPGLAFPQKEGGDEEKELFDDEETESS